MMPSSGKRFFSARDGARHQAFRIARFAAVERLQLLLDHREQRQRRNAAASGIARRAAAACRSCMRSTPGMEATARCGLLPSMHEYRIDQILRREHVLTHEAPREVVAPHAAHAQRGEAAVNVHLISAVFGGGNFCTGPGILPSDELIVSRFSSLSGCLNPKLRRFAPGLYPLYRGLFISAICRRRRASDSSRPRHSSTPCRVTLENSIAPAPAAARTFGQGRGLLRHAKACPPLKAATAARVPEPVDQLRVERRQRMARVHDHHHARRATARDFR